MKITPQQIKKKYKKLPSDIKEVMFSVSTSDVTQEIGKKYNLHIDKMGELSDEIGLVMFGFTRPPDFIKNIRKRLEVDNNTAQEIARKVNEKIFKPIKSSLMGVHGVKNDTPVEQVEDEPLKREEVLKEIEDEPEVQKIEGIYDSSPKSADDATSDTKNIIEEKLSESFRMPKTETEYKDKETPNTTSSGYKEVDPYREPPVE